MLTTLVLIGKKEATNFMDQLNAEPGVTLVSSIYRPINKSWTVTYTWEEK